MSTSNDEIDTGQEQRRSHCRNCRDHSADRAPDGAADS